MTFKEILLTKKITRYKLSKISGVPQSTIEDIYSGKTSVKKCSAETIYLISKALGISMEMLLKISCQDNKEYSFDVYKSNVCHKVKEMGDMKFIKQILLNNTVRELYDAKKYPESFYLLGMLDYLSRENNLPICTNYNDIRCCKLKSPVYPSSILAMYLVDKQALNTAIKEAIPEFLRFNIIEAEVRKVV